MMGYRYGMGWTWGWTLLATLLLVGLCGLVFIVVRGPSGRTNDITTERRSRPHDGSPGRHSRARDALDERYAGGDITTDEYSERLHSLQDDDWSN